MQMEQKWNNKQELERFMKLWDNKPHSVMRHTKEMWNIRADNWENGLQNDALRKNRSDARIAETVKHLRANGLLTANDDVVDIGCGPGRFVAEFAKTAHHVTGTDLSPKMLEYAAKFASSEGVENVSYTACDFKQADIDELGWRNRFDLVFTSITPAVGSKEGLEKAMAMSRGWCFNSSFIKVENSLTTEVSRAVFDREPMTRWSGRTSYALFNILWLKGFCPYVSYYTEESTNVSMADRELAMQIADNLEIGSDNDEAVEKIYRYVMQKASDDGKLMYPFKCIYVWLLWNIKMRQCCDSYEL